MGLLEGKRGVILGVANERSIAWSIARHAAQEGARLGFSFLGEAQERRVRPLVESIGGDLLHPMDVTSDRQVADFFEEVRKVWGSLDFLVHSVAFADKAALRDRFVATRRADFHLALDVSCYSLISVVREALPLFRRPASVLTLTYVGAVRAVPNYNVMGVAKAALEASVRYLAADLGPDGIRVNAVSAGPVKTLAASAIAGFKDLLGAYERATLLRRNITADDVGRSALYFLSDLSSGVTGEVHYVDAGFSVGPGLVLEEEGSGGPVV
ncbi:MAG TPA: enoyl-ACP reductase [Acidobacteriota bacterium]|jgi:enoyl-[acyl-carrier protein] reductase I|nr:enoyl-ACP reductase [Acidobacteriota bacterium]